MLEGEAGNAHRSDDGRWLTRQEFRQALRNLGWDGRFAWFDDLDTAATERPQSVS